MRPKVTKFVSAAANPCKMSHQNCEDDTISHCGSVCGQTFTLKRRKNTCTLSRHSIDSSGSRLRGSIFDQIKPSQLDASKLQELENGSQDDQEAHRRFNSCFHHYRYVVVMMSGFAFGLMLLLRYNITVAITKMVNQTALYMAEHPNKTVEDFLDEGYSLGGDFDWDNEIQQMVMSYYMIAYTLPQVATTKLGMRIGSRLAIFISLVLCAISTNLTPDFAHRGWQWVIALRMLNGLGGSAVLPMMLSIIENWFPYNEISLGLSCAQLLQSSLTALNPLLAGYLSAIHWSYAFYVPGIATLMFCLFWMLLITDRPDQNILVSQQELDLICGCSTECQVQESCKTESNKPIEDHKTPTWTDVLKFRVFYGYVFIWIFYCSAYSGFAFILPTYLRQFLKVDVTTNGFYCFIIQTGTLISVLWPHPLLRMLQGSLKLSETSSRRISHALVCMMAASTWIYVGLFHNTQVALLFLNRCFHTSNDIVVTGTLMSNFAKVGISGLVFSMVNTVGNISVVFASSLIGFVQDYTGQSREGWTWIWCTIGASQMLMLLIFCTIITTKPVEFKKDKSKTSSDIGQIQIICKDSAQKSSNKSDKV